MVALCAICLVVGFLGAPAGFAIALSCRDNAKWVKTGIIIGIIGIILLIVGVIILVNELPSSTGSSPKCQFIDGKGNRSCTNKATRGELCDYHFKMLDDIYHDFVG